MLVVVAVDTILIAVGLVAVMAVAAVVEPVLVPMA
jgi:hypothetical protein